MRFLRYTTAYVTRPFGPENTVGFYRLPLWMITSALHLAAVAVILWSLVGVVAAGGVIVGWL